MSAEPIPPGSYDDPDGYSAPEPVADLGVDHVLVRLAGERYAIRAPDVAAVIHVPPVTRMPGLPGWVIGVGSWRGRVLALVDLRAPLERPVTRLPSSARVVVLGLDAAEVGLVVEAVTGLTPIADEDLAPPPSANPAALLRGIVGRGPGGPVAVLDSAAVLALRSRLPQSGAPG